MTESHPLVKLARETIELYVREGRRHDVPPDLPADLRRAAGAFVTLHRHGELRGCIGTIQPTCASVVEEVIQNAISSATCDPRFPALDPSELADLDVKVDVMCEPEPITSTDQLDPKRYGLIVQSRTKPWKRGLLLPDLEGIDSVEKQVYWTRYHKAGISDPKEPVQMFRFEVQRLK